MTPLTSPNANLYPNLHGLDVRNTRVLLRVDYNIATLPNGELADDYRLLATLPTLRRLLDGGARVGILTHRGRPGGRVVPELSTQPFAALLSNYLGQQVSFVPDCVGRMAEQAMANLAPGQAVMFENVRFHLGEQLNQRPFVHELARLGDLFVNDAFATAHRAHASTSGLSALMPTALGDLMVRELEWVARIASPASRPITLLVGGNNVGPKLELIKAMLERVDTVMLAGAIANTFIAARDLGVGQSMLDPAWVEAARDVLTEAGVVGCRLHLPHDVIVTNAANPGLGATTRAVHEVGLQEVIHDIGPLTLATWQRLLQQPGSTIWLGCPGIVEHPDGLAGTAGIAQSLVDANSFALAAGNGLLPALKTLGVRERLPAVSTGGAALAAALLGEALPCLSVMKRKTA